MRVSLRFVDPSSWHCANINLSFLREVTSCCYQELHMKMTENDEIFYAIYPY